MPSAIPGTATRALNNVTLPYVLALTDKGWQRAVNDDLHLAAGLNIAEGRVVHPAIAEALSLPLSAN